MEWISVQDRLPEEYQECLIVQKNCHPADSVCYAFFCEGKWYSHLDEDSLLSMTVGEILDMDYERFIWTMREPSHWMELPKPPKDD